MGSSTDTRRTIRRAAYHCFLDHGYHDASVDMICRSAGASKGSFYYHYASKQACFADILERWSDDVIREVQQQFEDATQATNPFASLQSAFTRENVRGRLTVPLWLEFTVLARREPEIRAVLARFYGRARLAIGEMLRPFVGGGLVKADEIDGLSSAVLGAFIGLLVQEMPDPSGNNAGEASDAVLKVMGRTFERIDPTRWAGSDSQSRADERRKRTQLEGIRVSDARFEAFIAASSAPVRQSMAELRELILQTAPAADERLIQGWRVLAYDVEGLFCYLKPQQDHVDLGFYHGAQLDDPGAILTGRGKRTRHTPVRAGGVGDVALGSLISRALEHQRDRLQS